MYLLRAGFRSVDRLYSYFAFRDMRNDGVHISGDRVYRLDQYWLEAFVNLCDPFVCGAMFHPFILNAATPDEDLQSRRIVNSWNLRPLRETRGWSERERLEVVEQAQTGQFGGANDEQQSDEQSDEEFASFQSAVPGGTSRSRKAVVDFESYAAVIPKEQRLPEDLSQALQVEADVNDGRGRSIVVDGTNGNGNSMGGGSWNDGRGVAVVMANDDDSNGSNSNSHAQSGQKRRSEKQKQEKPRHPWAKRFGELAVHDWDTLHVLHVAPYLIVSAHIPLYSERAGKTMEYTAKQRHPPRIN